MPITTTPAEADPALRPGRTEGKARDCAGERFRSLLAALLLALGVATLPACDGGDKPTGTDSGDPAGRAAVERKAGERSEDGADAVWREAMATDPDDWSEELKTQIQALVPDSTIEEIAEGIHGRRAWQEAMATDPAAWSEELEAKLLALRPGSTIEEIAEAIKKSRAPGGGKRDSKLESVGRRIRAAVERGELTPEEGRRKYRQAAEQLAGKQRGPELEGIGRRIRAAVERGEITAEEGRRKLAAMRKKLAARANEVDLDLERVGQRIRRAVEAGEMTPEEGRRLMQETRQRVAPAAAADDELKALRRGVIERAMAVPPEEWSGRLKAAIERAGWELEEFAEGIRKRQENVREREAAVRDQEADGD